MEIKVVRFARSRDATLGRVYYDGAARCYSLEDQPQAVKVAGETRIPAGRYEIKLREEGGMIRKYRDRYGDWHRGMLHLQNVPEFKYIYIHTGNTDDHSEGCILVGLGSRHDHGDDPIVTSSRAAYEPLARAVTRAIDNGEDVFITIEDRD